MDRQAFLDRIAQKLGRPRVHQAPPRAVVGAPEFYRTEPWGGAADAALRDPRDPVERFRSELEAVGGEVVVAANPNEVRAALERLIARFTARNVATWGRSELKGWELDWIYERGARAVGDAGFTSEDEVRSALLSADVGITGVDHAIANTGTLVVSASPLRPRSMSLLPSHHVALVRESQLLARMGEALAAYAARGLRGVPSAVHFITGPSRTSDIENDLTIGVHGPAAVTAVLLRGA